MAIKSGFFNASNHDRMYNAEDFGDVLSMAITDGVDNVYLDKMIVTAGSGLTVNVGTGRAFFNGHYVINDSAYNLSLEAASTNLSRIDAIIIDVKGADAYREVTLDVIKGTASSSPVKPTLIKNDSQKRWQYALAYVTIPSGAVNVLAANIEDVRGTSECPWIIKTGAYDSVLSSASINAPQTKVVKAAIDNANTNTANGLKDNYKVMGYNGAKNLLPITIPTKLENGTTFTLNSDNSISTSGNSTSASQFNWYPNITLKKGSYVLSGCPSGGVDGSTYKYMIQLFYNNGAVNKIDGGSGISFTVESDVVVNRVAINVYTGYGDGLTFYPMLRYNEDTDTTYQPYAMTNKELTKGLVPLLGKIVLSTCRIGASGFDYSDCNDLPVNSFAYGYAGEANKPGAYGDQYQYLTLASVTIDYLVQIAFRNANTNLVFTRRKLGTTWTAWTELAPKSAVKESTRATYTGKTLPNNVATEFTLDFPSGYTYANSQIVSVALVYNNTRYYMGLNGSVHTYIGEVYMTSSGIIVRAVNSTSSQITCDFEIGLQKV